MKAKILLILLLFSVLCYTSESSSTGNNLQPWLDGVPTPLPLISKRRVSPDTYIYRFGLKSDDISLGIGVCSCILMSPESPSSDLSLTRPYTPISKHDQLAWFELLIKHYDRGSMGKQLKKLSSGDCMLFRQIPFNIKKQYPYDNPSTILMLAAGTGITPMYQALQRIFTTEDNNTNGKNLMKNSTKIILLYGCRTEKDMLLRKELEEFQAKHPDRFQIYYAFSQEKGKKSKKGTVFKSGRIDKEMILNICQRNVLISKKKECQVWVCGPPSFYESISGKREDDSLVPGCILEELNFELKNVVKF